jgi:hypothetical protein
MILADAGLLASPSPTTSPPRNQSFDEHDLRGHRLARKKRTRRENATLLVGGREIIRARIWGVTFSGVATREASAQAELRPTCAGAPRWPNRSPKVITGKINRKIGELA